MKRVARDPSWHEKPTRHTSTDRQRTLWRVDQALSKAQQELSALLYHGAAEEIPATYMLANELYDAIETLRRRMTGR